MLMNVFLMCPYIQNVIYNQHTEPHKFGWVIFYDNGYVIAVALNYEL